MNKKILNKINFLLQQDVTKQEITILSYFKKNYNSIKLSNMEDVSVSCYCSTTSINRVCKKLGFDSFTEFKIVLNYLDKNFIKEDIEHGKCSTFDKAISIIKNEITYIYGFGASYITCQYLQRQLLKLGYNVVLINDFDLLITLDIKSIIFITLNGETKVINKFLKNKDVESIVFTLQGSTSDKLANVSITHNINYGVDNISNERQIVMFNLINQFTSYLEDK